MASPPEAARAAVYTDFGGFAAMRREARDDPSAALDAVARQFEALFLQQILEQTRTTGLGEDVLGGDSVDRFTEMLHQQLAQELAAGEGLGLREVLVRQLRGVPGVPAATDEAAAAAAPAPAVPAPSLSAERAHFEARAHGAADD